MDRNDATRPATPDDKAWEIYRYLKQNVGAALPSQQARTLLMQYMQLGARRPSLVHSLVLGVAVKMADAYPDFKLPAFVGIWDIANLRPDDYAPSQDKQGRSFRPLAQRVAAALLRYAVIHPDEPLPAPMAEWAQARGAEDGFLPARPMVAVKMFEGEHQGRKTRMVKLVGGDGSELSADWRIFHAKPWEIAGRIYTVLPRRSEKSGRERVDTAGACALGADTVFGRVIGYVDSYDAKHRQYHIFDNTSRHFVAEAPALRPQVGGFVWFAPVVPAEDPFKSAIVLSLESQEAGREAFGPVTVKVEYVNTEKGYLSYTTDTGERAFVPLKAVTRPIKPGDEIRLITYMRRGRDGNKRPYTAEAF